MQSPESGIIFEHLLLGSFLHSWLYFFLEILMSQVSIIDRAEHSEGRCWSHGNGTLMNETNTLQKRIQRDLKLLLPWEDTARCWLLARRWHLPDCAGALTLLGSEPWENKFLLFSHHPVWVFHQSNANKQQLYSYHLFVCPLTWMQFFQVILDVKIVSAIILIHYIILCHMSLFLVKKNDHFLFLCEFIWWNFELG